VTYLSLVSVLLLVFVHLWVGRMHFLQQDHWQSVGAGIAMSYVFLDVLPHLASKQAALKATVGSGVGEFLEHHAYLLALAGFVIYYGLALLARSYSARNDALAAQGKPHLALYLLGLALSTYCFLIGYLIGEQPDHRYEPVIIFALAMSMHLAEVGHTARDHDPRFYDRVLRYALAGATFAGWLSGAVTRVSDIFFALVFSFVVGAILILAFVYELPHVIGVRRYRMFVAGVVGFSALLLLYEALAKTDLPA